MITIQEMTEADAPGVAPLCAQLGYPSTAEEVAERFANIVNPPLEAEDSSLRDRLRRPTEVPRTSVSRDRQDHCMLVARDEQGHIVGWVHAHFIERLHVARYADVAGLVVDERARRKGAAKALMQAVEDWARSHHLPRIRLRSGQHRVDAHAFYESIGYRHVTTPKAFEKTL